MSTMTSKRFKAILRGALKSLTVWAAVAIAALPELVPIIQANFATVAPFIPESLHSRTNQLLALLMLGLRLKTSRSLADKGHKPDPA